MKFGTIAYENEIYNLDYMTTDEVKHLGNLVEKNKINSMEKNENFSDNISLGAILSLVYTNKLTEETIQTKINHQLNSLNVTIDRMNPKFKEKSKNYYKIKDEILKTLSSYELVLKKYSQKYDKKIQDLIMKKVDLESKLKIAVCDKDTNTLSEQSILKKQKEINTLARKINNLNEKKKIKLWESLEVGEKALSTKIQKPKTFSKITKFFSNRFNTYNIFMKNVIEPLNSRIDDFKANELKDEKDEINEFDFKSACEKIEIIIKNTQDLRKQK